jgi:hypothetical protein
VEASERSLRAKLAAHTLHATRDPRAATAAARSGFLKKFERQADPGGTLPEAERARRAEHLLRAHMARLALASARARRKRGQS